MGQFAFFYLCKMLKIAIYILAFQSSYTPNNLFVVRSFVKYSTAASVSDIIRRGVW